MSDIDDGGPAFPTTLSHWNGANIERGPGASLRDYFAAHASDPPDEWLANMMNHHRPYECGGLEIAENIAKWKYMQADAMLAARATTTPAGEVQG